MILFTYSELLKGWRKRVGAIRDRLNGYIKNGDIACGSILVRKRGEIVSEEYLGYADVEKQTAVTKDSVFRLASMTKPVTAAAILILAGEGKLALTDPISEYVPEFESMAVAVSAENGKVETVPANRPLTIEDLLRHRSGIGHGAISLDLGVNRTEDGMTLIERTKYIASFPLDFQPGTEAGYSAHCAFDVLGRIIEVAGGMRMEDFLKERLFDPLSMTDTTFFPNEDQKRRTVRLYSRASGVLTDSYPAGKYASPFAFSYPCGSAGLSGTLSDYDKFVQMLSGRSVRILPDDAIRRMASADATLPSPKGAWGLGVYVFNGKSISGRGLSQGCFGWSGALGTHFYIDPVNDVTVTLMVNRMDIGGSGSYVSFGMEEAVFEELKLKEA